MSNMTEAFFVDVSIYCLFSVVSHHCKIHVHHYFHCHYSSITFSYDHSHDHAGEERFCIYVYN